MKNFELVLPLLKKATLLYTYTSPPKNIESITKLKEYFKKVHVAENGKEALFLYLTNKEDIDLVVIDLDLDNISGLDVMCEIRKDGYELPLFISTDFSNTDKIKQAIKLKVADYILKPIQMGTSLKLMNSILDEIHSIKLIKQQKLELENYKEALDQQNLITEFDANCNFLNANKYFCDVSGYKNTELIGQNHSLIKHPSIPILQYEQMWKSLKDGKIWSGKTKALTKQGDLFHVKETIMPVFDVSDKIEKYISIKFLITDEEEEKKNLKKMIMQHKSDHFKEGINIDELAQEKANKILEYNKNKESIKHDKVSKLVNELDAEIKLLRQKDADQKARLLGLENKLKVSTDKLDTLQSKYQARANKLHATAVKAIGKYEEVNKKFEYMESRFTKSQESINVLQEYIEDYRIKIKNLKDVIENYEKSDKKPY